MCNKIHENMQLRIKNVCKIVQEHYEVGNQQKCYKAVWRKHVYPVYPMCYRTFLKYVNYSPRNSYPAENKSRLILFPEFEKPTD